MKNNLYKNISYSILLMVLCLSILIYGCKKDKNNPGETLATTVSIMPTSGLAGTIVIITGIGFSTDTNKIKVTFNGKRAMIQSAAATKLVVTVPDATTGDVVVSINGKEVKGPVYTFQSLSINSIMPVGGPQGTTVTIKGAGLTYSSTNQGLSPAVYFNGVLAKVAEQTPEALTVIVPDKAGFGPVTITLGNLKTTGPVFNYVGFDNISPATGNSGTKVTLTGGFGTDYSQATITFNGAPATILSSNQGQYTVTVPNKAGTGQVVIKTGGQTIKGPVFSFVSAPTISNVAASSGPAGTPVTITGTGFSSVPAENIVTFNGITTTVTTATATKLTLTSPVGATNGPVIVNTNGQSVTGPVYNYQNLGISSVSPNNAPLPATVTVNGIGFSVTPSQNLITFNGIPVTVISATATQLVVTVPANVTTGAVAISVNGLLAKGPNFTTTGVFTLAGGTQGLRNGKGKLAQFSAPSGIAVDATGNVFIADLYGNNIRKIAIDGMVTTFAGSNNGNSGNTDAKGVNALFNQPVDIVSDKQGNLYVADYGNTVIRKIANDGTVTTFATMPNYVPPGQLATDAAGNIYVADNSSNNVYQFNAGGRLINTLNIPQAGLLYGIAVDAMGNVYTMDISQGTIFKGTNPLASGFSQYYNCSMAFDNNGNLLVTDGGTNQISQVNINNGVVSKLTGGLQGYTDGSLSTALFYTPVGIRVDSRGSIYVADQGNFAVRKVVQH